ncbi:hypothetical protein TR13x_04980 [Caloranaerobacter sp. TR13]|uniref:Ig-like domain-containing protein n=1 Tax=Caloranaerobacter sp. TR13 TaxID=1302151 RepID=UPI0006D3BABB|nr:Ig-like domain-containing protein [Caloranaerobacter sp. TR13]KPU27427.1 hypothetical protein TR13x_04980 [Caloranaerobacter sp. TR13]
MKKVLSLVLVLALVLGTFSFALAAPSTPDYTEAGSLLKDLGVLTGDASGDLMLDKELKRQDMIVLLSRLMGKEDVAKNFPFAPTFTDVEDPFYAPYIAWAQAEGITNGIGDNLFGFNQKLTVAQLQTFLLRALGYENAWENRAQLVEQAGLMAGLTAEDNAVASRGLMAAVTVNTLKATVNGKDKTLAAELNLQLPKEIVSLAAVEATAKVGEAVELPATVTATYDDGTTADVAVTWAAVDTSAAGTVTVEGTVEGTEIKAVATVTVEEPELAVESVTATNLKEVVVKFNKAVDATEAAKTDNYSVKDNTVALATVADDNMSVTLTLGTAVAQQSDIEVTVKKALGLSDDVTMTVSNVIDVTIPVAESIKLTGPKTFEITFSEPVQEDGTNAKVLVENGVYGVASKTLSTDGRTLTVTLSASSLAEGNYEVKVSGYKDFANFAAMTKTFTLAYAKDTTIPTVTLKSATQTEVKVEFDRPVYIEGTTNPLTVDYFYHTYSAWKPYSVTTTDNKVYTLQFKDTDDNTVDPILPEGNVVITVLYSANDKAVEDAWGNKMTEDVKLVATIEADNTAPTVEKVEATAEDTIEVTFSEDVNTPTSANFVIKDSEAKEISQTISNIAYDSEKYVATLTLSSKLSGGNYTIEVKDITDKALAANKITAVTLSFTVTDKTPPTVSSAVYVDNASGDDYVYVTFSESMATSGEGSILDKNNYRLYDASASKDIELPTDAKVELFGSDKKVKITLPDGTDFSNDVLRVGRVADAQGNFIVAFQTDVTWSPDAAPQVTAVNFIDKNKIEITVDRILTTVVADGFTVTDGTYTAELAAISFTTDDDAGTTTITGTLKAEVALSGPADDISNYQLNVVADKIQSETGKYMAASTIGSFGDKYAPSFSAIADSATADQFTITFDENIVVNTNELAAIELVIVDKDGKTLTAISDYTVSVNNDTMTVTLVGDYAGYTGKLTVSTKDTVNYIKDAAGNVVNAFADKEVTIE